MVVIRELEEGEELSSVSSLPTQESSSEEDTEFLKQECDRLNEVVTKLLAGRSPIVAARLLGHSSL